MCLNLHSELQTHFTYETVAEIIIQFSITVTGKGNQCFCSDIIIFRSHQNMPELRHERKEITGTRSQMLLKFRRLK